MRAWRSVLMRTLRPMATELTSLSRLKVSPGFCLKVSSISQISVSAMTCSMSCSMVSLPTSTLFCLRTTGRAK